MPTEVTVSNLDEEQDLDLPDPDAPDDEYDGTAWRGRALESMTRADAPMVLAFAMLQNLAEDLALMRRMGVWVHDPVEMWAHPMTLWVRCGNHVEVNSHSLLRELAGPAMQTLYATLEAGTRGRVQANRGLVVRMAKAACYTAEQKALNQGQGSQKNTPAVRRSRARTCERRAAVKEAMRA